MSRILDLKEKLEANPSQIFHRYSLALAYQDEGEIPLACIELEKCLSSKPDWMMVALFLGKNYLELGIVDKAKERLELAMKLAQEQNHDDPASEAESLPSPSLFNG